METSTLGKVQVAVRIENAEDLTAAKLGVRSVQDVRLLDIPNALVDAGCTGLSLPLEAIERLGLVPVRSRVARTANGMRECHVYSQVRLTLQGRDCTVEVVDIPNSCPVLIGQIPLEILDFVVDPAGQRLIGNPAHGGEHMIEMYTLAPY